MHLLVEFLGNFIEFEYRLEFPMPYELLPPTELFPFLFIVDELVP